MIHRSHTKQNVDKKGEYSYKNVNEQLTGKNQNSNQCKLEKNPNCYFVMKTNK